MQRLTETFRATYWYYEEQDGDSIIHIEGRNAENVPIYVHVHGFEPYTYVELPLRKGKLGWDKYKADKLYKYLQSSMGEDAPTSMSLRKKKLLHYSKKIYCMYLTFRSDGAIRKLSRKFNSYRGFEVYGLGKFASGEFICHELNVDAVIKFTARKNILLSGWIKVKQMKTRDEEYNTNFATKGKGFHVKEKDVFPAEPPTNKIIDTRYISFDIECYSVNHNSKLPNPLVPENEIFQVAMISGKLNDKNYKRILLSLGKPRKDKMGNCDELLLFKTEKKLLLKFKEIVQEEDPDIFIGYNTMKFDWGYMIDRAEYLGIYKIFSKMSRISGRQADLKNMSWSSSAYGEQNFSYLECHGRSNVDVLIEVEKNFKLPKYTLDNVAEIFLNKHKDDVSARGLFMLYQLTKEILPLVYNRKFSMKTFIECKGRIDQIFLKDKCHGIVKNYRKRLMTSKMENFQELCQEAMEITGMYCIQDTILPIELAEKLNLWITMEQMSNVTHIPISYIQTRGQQIKVLAQVYRECKDRYVIPMFKKNKTKEKYQGATVIEAVPGYYELIPTLDFASLYPTIMMAYNICYTTIVEDDDPILDEECNVLEWSDHVACIVNNSKVSMNNMSKKIQNIEEGEKVYGIMNGYTTIKPYKVNDKFNQGIKDCIRLTLLDGTILECTPDHKILVNGNVWKQAIDVNLNKDTLSLSYNPPIYKVKDEFYFAEEMFTGEKLIKLLQIFGILLSDGCIEKHKCTLYTVHEIDTKNMHRDMKLLFDEDVNIREQNYGWSMILPGKYGVAFRKLEGVIIGKSGAHKRCIPKFIKTLSKGAKCAFLSGLFGGDGHTLTESKAAGNLGTIKLSWTSENEKDLIKVFKDLSQLLKDVGFDPIIYRCGKETILGIPATETLKFHKKINFAYCVHKSIRLEVGCMYLRHRDKVWNTQKKFVDKVKKLRKKMGTKDAWEKVTSKFKNLPIYNTYYHFPSYSQIKDLLRPRKKWEKPMFSRKHFPSPKEFLESINAYDIFKGYGVKRGENIAVFNVPIIHIEDIGKHQVWDIEVKKSHTFLVNGIVVHNCSHDPQKRKRKKEDVMCKDNRLRFRRPVYNFNEDGTYTIDHEGLMPQLERKLLSTRKSVKKEMNKVGSLVKMNSGHASEKDISDYRKKGWEIIEKDTYDEDKSKILQIEYNVKDATQKALKISANSAYGAMGVTNGKLPLVKGAAAVTAMGRRLINMAIDKILETYPFSKLVYGDTDSCMMYFSGKNINEVFALAEEASLIATNSIKCNIIGIDENYKIEGKYIREWTTKSEGFNNLSYEDKSRIAQYQDCPIDLEFEQLYGKFLLLTKKRYIAEVVNEDGDIISRTKKGVVLTRRDNCKYLRDTYSKIINAIFMKKGESDIMEILYDRIKMLLAGSIPDTDLLIYMGVKSVINYAINEEVEENGVTVKVFLDANNDAIEDPIGPLDPRLQYRNIPQVLLSLKMLRRGDEVPANTRLEFLYLENKEAEHQGEKAEDFTYYKENKAIEKFKPDHLHYIEKQLARPITELLNVMYPKGIVPYVSPEDKFKKFIKDMNDLHRVRVMRVTKHDKKSFVDTKFSYKTVRLNHHGEIDRINYIFDEIKYGKGKLSMNKKEYNDLFNFCHEQKSIYIIDRIHKKYNLRRKRWKKPQLTNKKLRIGLEVVMMTNKYEDKGVKKGDICTVSEMTMVEDLVYQKMDEVDRKKAKNKELYTSYIYTVSFEKLNMSIENVNRKHITAFVKKDGTVMDDIYLYIKTYKSVVEEINNLWNEKTDIVFE